MSSDLTFLTNEPGKSLRDRFGVLLHDDTRFFDCLVGYFFISGFYKLYPALENVEKIRILVGLQTDRTAYELMQRAKEQSELILRSHASAKEQVAGDVLNELEKSPDTLDVETGVHKFVEWLRSGKLEIKAYPTENLHAKVYIMTFREGDRDKGRVITGSSNLTQSGLVDNLEFNVELKTAADYDFALSKFEELWAVAVDVRKPYEDTVVIRSPFAHFTPQELYLKFLYEYFRDELNRPDELEDIYVPSDFKRLKYQEEAVLNAKRVLEEYGGLFLSDVVGLGKTYMAALLARQLEGRSLVIAPPHLLDENNRGSWPNVFHDFQVRQTKFVSTGKIEDLLSQDPTRFDNVFIDESHRFRTETTQTYETLAQICRGKRVILVSATPLNNTPRDILSQVKLFQNGKNSTIPNVRNLEAFFSRLEKNLQGLDRQRDRDEYFKVVQENAKATREQILKYLMIRRTRHEITKYYGEDLELQGLKFPEVADPRPLFYKFNTTENDIFTETVLLVAQEFKYARYKPLSYYEGKREQREVQSQSNLARFMKILLIKRLESSFHAFRLTVGRFLRSYDRVIEEFHKGQVFISKKHINKIFDLLETDNQEAIDVLLEADKAERLNAGDFNADFIRDLEADREILQRIQQLWARVSRDPKWEAFRDMLNAEPRLKEGKLIIFTESKETAEYLNERIASDVERDVLLFTGSSDESVRREVIANFDARAFHPEDQYRILVTTEVLAEGVNLHRSNTVINYDIPWNPTRLIQRVGRVNRVDTAFDTIHTYNFFPTEESNDLIKLKESAEAKIHAFIEMLGADARLLTEGEEIKSHDLFAKLTSKKTITGEDEEEESELEYLTEIRDVRDNQPELFTRIKRLPKKARSTRLLSAQPGASIEHLPSLLTYFRQGRLEKFFLASEVSDAAVELDFFNAARVLKPADPTEPRQAIPQDFYALLDKNKAAFEGATSPDLDDAISRHKGGANDFFDLHNRGNRDRQTRRGIEKEISSLKKQIKALDAPVAAATAPVQREFGDLLSEVQRKLPELRRLHRELFEAASGAKKKELREELFALEWEFMDATVRENGDAAALKQLQRLRTLNYRPFFLWKLYFLEAFQNKGGFDVLIANPPYGFRQIHSESAKQYFKAHFLAAHRSFEHYFLFYEASLKLLKPDGVLAFIAPVTWLTIPSAESLREFILRGYAISEICWLSEEVFENASVNTLISLIRRREPSSTVVKFFKERSAFPHAPEAERTIPQTIFVDAGYYISIFSGADEAAVLDKVRLISRPLVDFARPCSGYNPYEVGTGVAPEGGPHTEQTVSDKPYHSIRKRGREWKAEIVGRDLTRYHVRITGERWIKYGPWLAAQRDPENFKGKRILVQEITGGRDKRLVAALYEGELYHSRDVIPIKLNEKPNPFYLLGLINSWLLSWYHQKCNPKAQKKLFPKVLVSDLKKLPIYPASEDEQRSIAQLVEQIVVAKQREPDVDTTVLECEIDQLVYELYGLTAAEIKLVESASVKTSARHGSAKR